MHLTWVSKVNTKEMVLNELSVSEACMTLDSLSKQNLPFRHCIQGERPVMRFPKGKIASSLSQIWSSLKDWSLELLDGSVIFKCLRSFTAEPHVKFQSHSTLSIDLAASRLDEIWKIQLTFL